MDKIARLANVPGLTRCILHFCSFYQMVILLQFCFTAWKPGVIPEKKFKLFYKGGIPARIFYQISQDAMRHSCVTGRIEQCCPKKMNCFAFDLPGF